MNIPGSIRRGIYRIRHHRSWLPERSRLPGSRAVALSFDDGPSPRTTIAVLQALRSADVRVAFFLNGRRAEQAHSLVAAIVADGHQVFSHGYDHCRFAELDDRDIWDQLERCETVLSRHRPTPSPYLVRLPYGSGHRDERVHRALRAWRSDCVIAHWGYSLEDYRLADGCTNEGDLRRRCVAAVDAAFRNPRLRGSILLLHEDPFDIDAPLAPRIAPILVDVLLRQAARAGVAIANGLDSSPTKPASRHPRDTNLFGITGLARQGEWA